MRDPAIATEFSTVAFRFGHSLLSSNIERHGNNGQDFLPNDPAGANLSLAIPHNVRNYACGHTPVCNECERTVELGTNAFTTAAFP